MESNHATQPADVAVVGSGPGGATVARELARAGWRVVVLERGRDHRRSPAYGTYLGPLRYADRGTFLFTRQGMNVVRPLMVGGATGMFCGSASPPPAWLAERYGIDLSREAEETIRELRIAPLAPELRGEASTRIADAAASAGMEWEPQPKFMDPARCPRGFDCGAHCMLGCRCGAKWNAAEYLDEAVSHGAESWTRARVERVVVEDGEAVGVAGRIGRRPFEVRARTVVLAAGGLGTPRILRASGIPDAGRGLAMDSTIMVYGLAPDGRGIAREPPMTWGWTDHEHGYMLSTLIDPWLLYPLVVAHGGLRHLLGWARWGRMLGVMVKIKDNISGEIADDGTIDKPWTDEDRRRLEHGERAARRILRLAGCDPDTIVATRVRGTHPSATARIGHVVDRDLRAPIRNLYVCDASVFPEALDAPTVLTIVALAKRLAAHLVASRGGAAAGRAAG